MRANPEVGAQIMGALEPIRWLENDHRLDWATSGLTVFDLLERLCSHHHDRKSLDGWWLVEGRGKRPFVPPEDSHHPRSAYAPPEVAA